MTVTTLFLSTVIAVTLLSASTANASLEDPEGSLSRGLQQLYSGSHFDNRHDDEFDWVLVRRPRINKRLSEFLGGPGKRYSEFLGGPGKKRYSEFLGGPGKRYSEFLGGPGKRYSEFLGGPGKRSVPSEPVFAEQDATMSRR